MRLVTLTAQDDGPLWAGNTHRVFLKEENTDFFIGWPDPADKRNSEHWKPGVDKPLQYPRLAWKEVPA